MWIEERIGTFWEKTGKSERAAFLWAFAGGLTAHLYIYTNTIPNFDGLSRVYDEQQMTMSGRWFLHYASYLHGFTQMPMVDGTLACLMLALAAMLTVRLFRVKSRLLGGLWGLLSVVFPVVAYTNAFTFTVAEYGLALLLAVACVWATDRRKWGFLPGMVLLAFSMGIYQVYVTVAIVLSLFKVLEKLFDRETGWREALWRGICHVLSIGLGTALYYGILKIFLAVKDLKLSSYRGMDVVESGYPLGQIPGILAKTYSQCFEFFFREFGDNAFFHRGIVAVNVLVAFAALLLLALRIAGIWEGREGGIRDNAVKTFGTVLCVCLVPLAVNFGQVLSPYSSPSATMKYAFVYVYFLPLLLLEWDNGRPGGNRRRDGGLAAGDRPGSAKLREKAGPGCLVTEALAGVLVTSLLIISVYSWEYGNVLYTMLNQVHRSTLSFVTNVVSRIEGLEGYQYGMPVVIVGGFPSDRYGTDIEIYKAVEQGGALSSSVIPMNKHIYYYMKDWLNVPVEEPEEEVFLHISQTEEFLSMPLYPADGSVRLIEGSVVVKMQETFTPKSDYEKEYEKRR